VTRTWNGVLARLGVPTGDGRIIAPGGGSSRSLPLPLLYQPASGDGHGGAVVVGSIDELTIRDGMVTATGHMLDAAYGTDVLELLDAGVIGPSVDLDDVEYTMDDQERIVITSWRIAGATLVAIPAFEGVSVTLDPLPVAPEDAEAQRRAEARGDVARPMTAEEGAMLGESLFASATPVLPPAEWFMRPDLDRLTPLTVSDSGRVFGHIAPWGQCHVGLPGCVTAPASVSNYAYFHTAEQATQDGPVLPVGTLVAGPRHADAGAAFQAAVAHYDDPAAAVARVVAGEDEFGIWVAGWLLPGAAPEAVEVFRTSPVSGDWRRIGGALELIAVCSVNAPGFPVPRARVAFSAGAQRSLIGSFGITPVTGQEPETMSRLRLLAEASQKAVKAKWAWATTGMES
jgi:hypothetical protein